MARRKVQYKTRRGNKEGSIVLRKDGRWTGVATVGYDENGKIIRKAVYGKSRMEVADKLTKLTNRIANENLEYIDNNTFGEMMKEWMLVFKKQTVTPRTFEGNFRNFELHILPKIGNMKIDEITTIVVQKLLNEMLEEGYNLATTRKIKHLLNQFFEYAIDNKLTNENPAIRTKVKSSDRKIYDSENKYKAIPIDIRNKFLECLETNDFLKPLCMTMMFAGLRSGEVLALTWDNIDFENKVLKVEKAITIIPKYDSEGKVKERITVVSNTKTACSVREVPMPDILVEALKEYRVRQEIIGEENNIDLLTPTSFVFCNDDGSLRTYYGTRCIFRRFLKKHKLNKYGIHFHGLRHTYSNMLFEANQNPKVIQGLLGHKSVKTTITTYNSVDKSYFKQATDVINNQFKPKEEVKEQTLQEKFENLSNDDYEYLLKLLEERRNTEQEQNEEQEQYEDQEDKYENRRRERDYEMEM